jgi:putative FmdB family regulatory protein
MPFYEYRCRACGKVYEQYVRSLLSKVETVCPACGSTEADKNISLFGTSSSTGTSGARSQANCAPSGGG